MPTMQEMYAKSEEAGFNTVFDELVKLEPIKRVHFCIAILKSLADMCTEKKAFLSTVCKELLEEAEPIVEVKCSLCDHMIPVPEDSKDLVHICVECITTKKGGK